MDTKPKERKLSAAQLARLKKRQQKQQALFEEYLARCSDLALFRGYARAAIKSYLNYKMEGSVHKVPSLPKDNDLELEPGGPTLEEIIGESYGLGCDVDLRNYQQVGQWLSEYVEVYPQDKQIEELLVHTRYFGRDLLSCQISVPFTRVAWPIAGMGARENGRLSELAQTVYAGADAAITRFEVYVAKRKREGMARRLMADEKGRKKKGLQSSVA
jgi:hypothetical protein